MVKAGMTSRNPGPRSRPPHPPASLDALRALSVAMTRGEAPAYIGRKAQEALAGILEMPGDPALRSITTLAQRLKVHPSTVTRLARSLGYAGFGAFQDVLLEKGANPPGAFYVNQARQVIADRDGGMAERTERLIRENRTNVDALLDRLNPGILAAAAAMIVAAPRVRIHGVRQFHALASFLVYGLSLVRSDVALLDAPRLGTAEGLAAMAENDLLIVASCAPYTNEVIDVGVVGKSLGLRVLALTDRSSSPLVAPADIALFVPHRSSFLSNSMAAFVVCAECLINACVAVMGDAATQALTRRERVISALGIEQ